MPAPIRNRVFVLAIGLLSSLALAQTASAQPRVEEKVNLAVTGDILSVDTAARSIEVKSTDDEGVVYKVDGAATIMLDAKKLELGDLKPGWNVVMNGHQTGDTRLVTYIKVTKTPSP